MRTLLYRFDDAEAFALLKSQTTARGPVTIRVDCQGNDMFLRVTVTRQQDDPPEITVVIALPLLAVDGKPEEFLLNVLGDASGCRIFAEAGDAHGWGFAYSFGSVDFSDWRTCPADARSPSEYWGEREKSGTPGIVPPVQLFKLGLLMSETCRTIDIGLGKLSVTGDVRIAPPGIA